MNLYEKKYNEILEWARKNKARLNGVPIEEVLPELAESDDERIREKIIDIVKAAPFDEEKDVLIAWLEKQKEQKPVETWPNLSNCIHDCKNCLAKCLYRKEENPEQKPDYCKGCNNIKGCVACKDGDQWARISEPAEWSHDDIQHRNKILLDLHNMQSKYKIDKRKNWKDADFYDVCMKDNGENIEWLENLPKRFNLQPKPDVECDNETEIQKAYREGTNAGRKEVFDHPEEYGLQLRRMYDYETGKRNPEWSEEDEEMINIALQCLVGTPYSQGTKNKVFHWLKSLKPQNQPMPEDYVLFMLGVKEGRRLEKQDKWKPSEEQMEALNALNLHGDLSYVGQQNQLISLYQDLKKLM